MQIFSTWGTSTCKRRIIVCRGSLARQEATHSGVGCHIEQLVGVVTLSPFECALDVADTRMLPRCATERLIDAALSSSLLAMDNCCSAAVASWSLASWTVLVSQCSFNGLKSHNDVCNGWADSRSVIWPMAGVSNSDAFSVPGSAGSAGRDPSIDASPKSLFVSASDEPSSSPAMVVTFVGVVAFTAEGVVGTFGDFAVSCPPLNALLSANFRCSSEGETRLWTFCELAAIGAVVAADDIGPFRLLKHFEMPWTSDGKLASAWNTCRFRIIVYTKFALPSNWYWMMLLNISSRKNTKWWLDGAENRNHGVLNASNKCNNFTAATIDNVFKYGETGDQKKKESILATRRDTSNYRESWQNLPFTKIVSKQSNSGWRRWCPVAIILWKTVINRSAWEPVKTGISIGTVAVYGLFNRTPKFRSPDNSNRMNTPMCMRPTRAVEILNVYDHVCYLGIYSMWRNSWTNTYIDRHVSRSNDIKSAQARPAHRCSSARNTKISYCNRRFSRKTPATLDGSADVLSSLANSFALADCSAAVWCPSSKNGNPRPGECVTDNWWINYRPNCLPLQNCSLPMRHRRLHCQPLSTTDAATYHDRVLQLAVANRPQLAARWCRQIWNDCTAHPVQPDRTSTPYSTVT